MLKLLKKPYPYLFELKRDLILAGVVSILSIYLNHVRLNDSFFYHNTIISHDYISFISGTLVGLGVFLVIHVIPSLFFSENLKENWNIGHELIISLGVFFTIFIFNYIFFTMIAIDKSRLLSISFFLKLAGYVISTGIVLFSAILWVNYTITLKRNLKHVKINNEHLKEKLSLEKPEVTEDIITMESTLKSEVIQFDINKLIYIKSEGNYVEICTKEGDKTELKLNRVSLQTIEDHLKDYPQIFRTHRSYLVNIENIEKTDGNARNYQIFFDGTDVVVPVSRSRFAEFNKMFMKS